jgi:hypothetical protein
MFILTANRLLLLAILISGPFYTVGTVVLPNSNVPQSAGSTPKPGQLGAGLEMLTDTSSHCVHLGQTKLVCSHACIRSDGTKGCKQG